MAEAKKEPVEEAAAEPRKDETGAEAPGMDPLNDERVPACRTVGRSAAAAQT